MYTHRYTYGCLVVPTDTCKASLGLFINSMTAVQEADSLRREVSRWENQARQRERRLAELERELLEKSSRVEALHRQLDDSSRQLEESRQRQEEAERKLALRLHECEQEMARQAAAPSRVKVRSSTDQWENSKPYVHIIT